MRCSVAPHTLKIVNVINNVDRDGFEENGRGRAHRNLIITQIVVHRSRRRVKKSTQKGKKNIPWKIPWPGDLRVECCVTRGAPPSGPSNESRPIIPSTARLRCGRSAAKDPSRPRADAIWGAVQEKKLVVRVRARAVPRRPVSHNRFDVFRLLNKLLLLLFSFVRRAWTFLFILFL